MRLNILFGGEAGQGPNILTNVLGESLVKLGAYVFYSRDYQSLIRGGHNFNVLTFSDEPIFSNDSEMDIIVALDDKTKKIHEKNLKKSGIILEGKHPNMFFAGKLFKILGLEFNLLDNELKCLKKKYEENIKEAREGYNSEKQKISLPKFNKKNREFLNGNQGLSRGALESGLEIYYHYPMTPATPVAGELANSDGKHLVLELENEISVANAGVGSIIAGAKVMVGTSGGGFDLMTETLSLCGIAEIPLVFYLSQRPGPSTGVATYTGQGDLKMALGAGHGEFNRIVLACGDPKEAFEITNQAFYLSHKYKTPSIILGDKHLAESFYTSEEKPKKIEVKNTTKLTRYNSYEKNSEGCATEEPEIIKKNILERIKIKKEIEKESEKFERYKLFGEENSKNIVISWGSTKGAILDAVKDLDCAFLQIIYLEPFPKEIEKILKNKNIILVENNATGSLADLIHEKTCAFIEDKNKILRFDGRPFLRDELKKEIERRIK